MSRTFLLGGLLLASPLAHAGGLGLLGTGGVHTGKAYYYNIAEKQGVDAQIQPNVGLGIEGVLGNRDDRIQGLIRFYYLADAPLHDPDTTGFEGEVTHPDYDAQGWESKGVATVGVQWALLGDPAGTALVLDTLLGSGFLTYNNLEFMLLDVGPGVTYRLGDAMVLQANAAVSARLRKGASLGGNAYLGVRYLFD